MDKIYFAVTGTKYRYGNVKLVTDRGILCKLSKKSLVGAEVVQV